jgi:uncharacterized membrane-anchored protein
MDWVPIVFLTFKLLVLGAGMYFAIKWHYDQGDKGKRGAALRTVGQIAGVFVLALLCIGLFAFFLSQTLGLDLGFH